MDAPAFAVLSLAGPVLAEDNLVFPPNSGIINVVTDRGVASNGRTDVTVLLNQILSENERSGDKNAIIYFPTGTYRISGRIRGPHRPTFAGGGAIHGPLIVGQSRTRTVIRLTDNTWPSDTLGFPNRVGVYPTVIDDRVVLHSGDCGNTTFQRQIRNLTVDIGKNNDGATGVVFIASNSGCMADVDIVSEDGKGCIGLSLSGTENGPLAVHNVRVKGFKRGVYCSVADVLSMSQVVLEDPTRYGFVNNGRCAVDSLKVRSVCPAVLNLGGGTLSLLNGYFEGGASDTAAVYNHYKLFARNLQSSGFKRALHCRDFGGGYRQAPATATIDEYLSRPSAGTFYQPGVSMNLPVKYPPSVAWEQDLAKWSNPATYKTGSNTWTAAFKSALSATGKTSVVIPWLGYPAYDITDTLRVKGAISRVIGTTANIYRGAAAIVVEDGTAPVVVLQNFSIATQVPIIIRTSRTVILESAYPPTLIAEGTGDLFLNDFMGDLVVRNPQQKVWVRKLNGEWSESGSIVRVESGTAWVLGFKSENEQNKVTCLAQGVMEVFGFMNYNVGAGRTWPAGIPLFDINGGQFCAAGIYQVAHGAGNDSFMVREIRGGVTKTFTSSMNLDWYECGLYTGFDPSKFTPAVVFGMPARRPDAIRSSLSVSVLPQGRLRVSFSLDHASGVDMRLTNAQGRTVMFLPSTRTYGAGMHQCEIVTTPHAAGAYWLSIRTLSGEHMEQLVVIGSR